jgi:hypothetical protein
MTTGHIPASLQRRVRLRASERCEYGRIAQVGRKPRSTWTTSCLRLLEA